MSKKFNLDISKINSKKVPAVAKVESIYNIDYEKLDISGIEKEKLIKYENDITFHGENVPNVDDEKKQTRELLEKHNISKEWLQKKSDELLDTVLTDWRRYSGSSYSRSNMGRLTIEKDEFLG